MSEPEIPERIYCPSCGNTTHGECCPEYWNVVYDLRAAEAKVAEQAATIEARNKLLDRFDAVCTGQTLEGEKQAATIAALELRLSDQHATIVRDAATIERLTTERDSSREASQQTLKQWRESLSQVERMREVVLMYKSAHGTCSMVRYDPCDFCIAAVAALNPQPSQPEYTSESMIQPKEKP